jgi:hypothetical protein
MLSVRKLVFAGALLAVVPFAAVAQETPKAAPKAMPSTGPTPGTVTTTPGTVITTPGAPYPAPGTVVTPGAPVVTAPGGACPQPCPPQTMKVCKMVPTQVQEQRTVMKQVQRQECYTAYRTETVQEKKCVPCTTYKTVTETVMENRTKCIKVPCMETKTVMEKRKKIEWVTETKEKCHISFKKECKTIGGCGLLDKCGDKLTSCFGDKCGGGGCGESCGGCSISFPVWKPCIEKQCVQVCRPKCTYECVPVCKQVCTYKTQTVTECVPVCKTRCVPCTEMKETVCCKKVCVPYQATRCVTECVPTCETVTVCKMVPTWVEVPCPAPAPCQPACPTGPNACANPCDTGANACCDQGGGKGGCCLSDKFGGFCDKLSCLKCDLGNKFSGCCDSLKCGFGDLCGKFSGCFSGFGGCCK